MAGLVAAVISLAQYALGVTLAGSAVPDQATGRVETLWQALNRLEGDDMIDAVRMLRAARYGFVSLEAAGGFGLPQSVDASFQRLIDSLDSAWSVWPVEQG